MPEDKRKEIEFKGVYEGNCPHCSGKFIVNVYVPAPAPEIEIIKTTDEIYDITKEPETT